MSVVLAVALIGVLILVHEAGHFVAAKLCGVRVLTFSIGFGPRLIGFVKGETEYRISVVPVIGGFVRMFGSDESEDVPPEERSRALLYQPYWKKALILVAGPLANFLLPIPLFFGLYVGHERVADAVVGTVLPGDAGEEAGMKNGDRVTAIDGHPIRAFSDMQPYVAPSAGKPLHIDVERADGKHTLVVTPRATPDPSIFDRKHVVGRLGVHANVEEPAVTVTAKSVAAHAGIKDRDRIVAVDGTPTPSMSALFAALDAAAARGHAVLDVVTPASEGDDGEAKAPPVTRKVTLDARVDGSNGDAHVDGSNGDAHVDGSNGDGHVDGAKVDGAKVDGAHVDGDAIGSGRYGVTSDELQAEQPVIAATRAAVEEALAKAQHRFGIAPAIGRVAHVADKTVAAEMQVQPDRDRIVAVDGKALRTSLDLGAALESNPDGIHVVGVVSSSGDARVLAFRMLPSPDRRNGGVKVFGVAVEDPLGDFAATVDRTVSPGEALSRAVDETVGAVVDVVRGFGLLLSGAVGVGGLSGPIGIVRLSSEAAKAGPSAYIHIMALISANLGVLNLVPIPVLDGGQLLFFTIEAVTRRKISQETKRKVLYAGVALVGLLMVVALANDVLGLLQ